MSDEVKKHTVYGIDLGTTYSAIAFVNDDGNVEIIPNFNSERITPSVVYIDEEGKTIVGTTAKETAKTNPDRSFVLIKREMGTSWTKELDGKTYTPEVISSFILKLLAEDAKATTGREVKDVVITCPAYFGDAERKATRAAGEIAGLNVLQILDEPVAAAMNYGLGKAEEGDRTAIVYDLGGGTFDVTVIEIKDGNVRVVCSDGDHRLGGANWDERIVTYFAEAFASATGGDVGAILGDAETRYDLQLQAETTKKILTRTNSAKAMVTHDGTRERVELSREKFEEMTKDWLDQTEGFTQKMIDLAKEKGIQKINDFLLVGGSTRMPQVMAMIKEKFASQVDTVLDLDQKVVDEAVAKGAAQFGHIKYIQNKVIEVTQDIINQAEEKGETKTVEEAEKEAIELIAEQTGSKTEEIEKANITKPITVASRSYGIKVLKSGQPVVYNLIKKQDPIPATFGREFPVSEANAEKLPLVVFANNELGQIAELGASVEVGNTAMDLPLGLPKGAPILVNFKLTEEGILEMDALDKTHGTPVKVTFEAKDGLTQAQIEAARAEYANLEIEG